MADRELVGVAKMGIAATIERRKAEDRSKKPQLQVTAIFGLISGHLQQPEGEVRNISPLADLTDELDRERRLLVANAGYQEDDLDLDEALA